MATRRDDAVNQLMPAKSLANAIRAEMERNLLNGALAPGQVFDERSFAERFGVSRTPVREAVQNLAAQGILKVVPRFGVVVPKLSATELRSLLEMLAELEGACAKFAAERMDTIERKALHEAQQAYEAAATARRKPACIATHRQFHEIIYASARNEWAVTQIRSLRLRCVSYQRLPSGLSLRLKQAIKEHRTVLARITAGEGEAARYAMIEHIWRGADFARH
jgi:DNA-binding GntR family transcriptional regulator